MISRGTGREDIGTPKIKYIEETGGRLDVRR